MFHDDRVDDVKSEEGADGLSVMGFGCDYGLGSYNGVDGVDGFDKKAIPALAHSPVYPNPDDFPSPTRFMSQSTPNPDDLPGPTTFMSPSLSSSSGNKGKSSRWDHIPAMMNTRRREMKQRDLNISCTKYEIENTALHVIRCEREISRTGQRNKDCATTASAHKHEVPTREASSYTGRVCHKTCVHGKQASTLDENWLKTRVHSRNTQLQHSLPDVIDKQAWKTGQIWQST